MTRFRPCIDLHGGQVKQIVGSSLSDEGRGLRTNFVAAEGAAWFASRYAADDLPGGHVILLGPGNEAAAQEALAAYPGGMQVGGGIRVENAAAWLDAGASHVIVTSGLFDAEGRFQEHSLEALVREVGAERLVIDLSCRAAEQGWMVAMNRWQTLTDLRVTGEALRDLSTSCAEFLIHAVDVEGKCEGIDEALCQFLGTHVERPMTYAGGIRQLEDFQRIDELSGGRVDATVGSALDLFGGSGVRYADLVAFNRRVGRPT
ncbi:MAG: phosphoribosylformimino-5-aminoimidazole carboxamide ribotide isomerase [Verrucomicrobiales bacterium]|nr:phosphoribosylformimino-5-aminoimidazole carboxamide ribotide isomerase [Verrucomicrobiales bacterium]